jgi:myo-inositol-1-phosphate synthase
MVNITSDNRSEDNEYIYSSYKYKENICVDENEKISVTQKQTDILFKTQKKVKRTGVMIVGLGGNNGVTFTGGIIANRCCMEWDTRRGSKKANYHGSITQSSCIQLGNDKKGKNVYTPFKSIVPMLDPNNIVVGGWDISNMPLNKAMKRSMVFEPGLIDLLYEKMDLTPLPGVYYPGFIAKNQDERANNILSGKSKMEHMNIIRKNIRDFKKDNELEYVIVLWSANTEKMVDINPFVHINPSDLLSSIHVNSPYISPSMIYAVASMLEGCVFLNGSPQNTIVPAIARMASDNNTFVGGSDFKSGQTKIKSMLSDYYISTGVKVEYVVSYNHLGNNDGLNLSSDKQFKSKEISKSGVLTDSMNSNPILYKDDCIDQCVVIKYVEKTKDTKIAIDEWLSSIFMGGEQRLVTYTTCEDSLLAVPIMYDMIILTELLSRITYDDSKDNGFVNFPSILSLLSYCFKAPLGENVCNILHKQIKDMSDLLLILNGIDKSDIMLSTHIKSSL